MVQTIFKVFTKLVKLLQNHYPSFIIKQWRLIDIPVFQKSVLVLRTIVSSVLTQGIQGSASAEDADLHIKIYGTEGGSNSEGEALVPEEKAWAKKAEY